ncbi:S-adenosyl-L-methionine-dependent methyltransferase [Aspergillus ambiguus]|uniref:S-adenosyl-L-methionine-dependent methyltransferase n=1 Tax=Aspergillus ambiguus TaxID=176160 RepID=UPI003CCD29CB
MDDLITRVNDFARSADEPTRSKLVDVLRDLSISLERPEETRERIAYTLNAARLARDLGLFERLSTSASPVGLKTLATDTGADVVLLGRVMRYLASVKMVDEPHVDTFTANNVTRALSSPQGNSYIDCFHELVAPVFHRLPAFLARTNYANPSNPCNVAMQDAFGVEGDMWAFLKACPKYWEMFDRHMQMQRDVLTDWGRIGEMISTRKNPRNDEVVFVDIGGGNGHECVRLQAACPGLVGRVILQDLPEVIGRALDIPGVELMEFYYMRGVLHDFPDDKSRAILKNLAAAMGPDSVLLIDEIVLPDKDVHWIAASIDMQMMSWLASGERTRRQWEALFESVGLSMVDVHAHRAGQYESLMVVRAM